MTDGLHHVTGICGPAQTAMDFYAGFLGLRFVKRTVNFDDPNTYHLYYGDRAGSPGSIMTFFPWPDAVPGRPGAGTVSEVSFAVPSEAVDDWQAMFADRGFDFDTEADWFGDRTVGLRDPDGLALSLVGRADAGGVPWDGGSIAADHAIGSFFGVTLGVADVEPTARVLTDVLGYSATGEERGRARFRSAGGTAAVVDVVEADARAKLGAGSIHHVAFRARNTEHQLEMREKVLSAGLFATDVKDRTYFRSVYFREPGGVLFEIATDGPGFTVDEPEADLGKSLKLPPWFETRRELIENRLVDLSVPRTRRADE